MRNVRHYRFVVIVLALLLLFGAKMEDGRAQEGNPIYLPFISQGVPPGNSASAAQPGQAAAPATETKPLLDFVNWAEDDPTAQPSRPDGPAVLAAAAAFTTSLQITPPDGSVEVPYDPALDLPTALTLEAWVRRAGGGSCETIVARQTGPAYWFGFCGGKLSFSPIGPTGVGDGVTTVPADAWTHVAVVWAAGGEQTYYINGERDQTIAAAAPPPTTTAPLVIGSFSVPGPDPISYPFNGSIAEVRVWNVARSQDDIRRTMHVSLDEPRPGLVATWHLADDFTDSVGGHDGTPEGTAALTGPGAPPLPPLVPIDSAFNAIEFVRELTSSATAFVPRLNRALLIGGFTRDTVNKLVCDRIRAVDAATGRNFELTSRLPTNLVGAAAAYVTAKDTVYVFGGVDFCAAAGGGGTSDRILAINPDTGAIRTLSARLPFPVEGLKAVYHAGLDKVYLLHEFGDPVGRDVILFDPATETSTLLNITVPSRFGIAAAWSSATGNIYIFGGKDPAQPQAPSTNAIFEIVLQPDGLGGVTRRIGSALLPDPNENGRAVEDPESKLIYLIGGSGAARVAVFDPLTRQVWPTLIQMPHVSPEAEVIYSDRNRHALVIDNQPTNTLATPIWRIPLGDGPALALGRWDFPAGNGGIIRAIDGDEQIVGVATSAGLIRFDAAGGRTTFGQNEIGSNDVADVRYDAAQDHLWAVTPAAAKLILRDGTVRDYFIESGGLGTASGQLIDLRPTYTNPDDAPFVVSNEGLWYAPSPAPGHYEWQQAFQNEFISALQHRSPGDLWLVSNHNVKRFVYPGPTILDLGMPCGQLFGRDFAFTPNFDVWIAAGDVTHPTQEGICRIPAIFDPTTPLPQGNILQPEIGLYANHLDLDTDARVWATIGSQCIRPGGNETGGLVAYSAVGFPARVRTTEWNWLNAPLGSRLAKNTQCAGPMYWVSALGALAAVDERVWASRFPKQTPDSGQDLVTFAPRWQQLDESNALDQKVVEGIWTVRGRAFMATADSLHILAPDGQTWDNRSGLHVRAVIGDQAGAIWLGADDGVRLLTRTGFDRLTGAEGDAPAGPVFALAEDRDGRIWIGHQDGLTLFDRGRFVTTLTGAVTGLPTDTVKALLVDRQNRLWVGTALGLAVNDGEQWTQLRQADGLPSDDIHDLAELGDGRIAVSTAGGLALATGLTFSVETPPAPAANLPLTVDELGRLWAGSAVLTAQGWQGYYSTNSGLRSSTVADNAADGADRIWFSHAPDPGVSVRGALLPPLADEVPIIQSVSPTKGRVGDILVIGGTGFGGNPADVEVTIGGARAEVIKVVSGASLPGLGDRMEVRLTAENTSGDVAVAVGGRRTVLHGNDQPTFCAIPTITGISPTGGNIGVRIQVNGANFDPDALVRLGGALEQERPAETSTPTLVTALIESSDGNGNVRVHNSCAGDEFQAFSAEEFRKIHLTITLVAFNQGYPSSGSRGAPADKYGASDLVQGKPTLVQLFLGTNDEVRPTDRLEVDSINLTYRVNDRDDGFETRPYHGPVPINPGLGEPSEAQRKDIVNSVFGTFRLSSPDFHGDDILEVIPEISRNHQAAASSRSLIYVYSNQRLNVLLIPIMQKGYTAADLDAIKNRVLAGLDDARYRIMPFGWTNYFWSPTVIEKSDHVEIGSAIDLFSAGLDLNDVRDHFNEFHNDDAVVAFGVVDPRIIDDSGTTGRAFWVDASEFANGILLPLDTACDLLTAPARLFGFGGCDLEIPLYIGWGRGDISTNRASELLQHETGHILGLVGASASNGEFGDNYSHSINDELDGGECGGGGVTFNWDKSLYTQPGVNEPVVNPITGQQLYPQNDGNPNTHRAKSIMSYACEDLNDNVFFEPVDVPALLFEYSLIGHRGWVEDLVPGLGAANTSAEAAAIPAAPRLSPTGPRLSVAGVISDTGGAIGRVKPLDDQAPLTFGVDSGYWLVQLDAAGKELHRDGVAPIQPVASRPGDPSFFTAKVLRQPGLARLELRRDNTVLDSFSAGSAAPQLTLTKPVGGAQSGPTLHVAWTASDPDGDTVRVTVEYSTNGGATWDALGFAEGSGTMDLPLAQLDGSSNARVRVSATDGLTITRRVSAPISVPVQAPRAYIGQPAPGATFMEGAAVMLSGSASATVTDTQSSVVLKWSSNRDGFLGSGDELFATLSVGTHVLTLQTSRSPTLTASASVTVTILPDYDFDGIEDAEEPAAGLNPLDARDVRTDQDGDGLPLIVERLRGLDPKKSDSDGDGRPDGEELAAGTDPSVADAPLAPDSLDVSPRVIVFSADMGRNTPLPTERLVITSRKPVSWTVTADVPWLGANVARGRTIDGVTIFLKGYMLQNGIHTGTLTFSSPQLPATLTVPVTATVTHTGLFFDLNDDSRVNIADVQSVAGRVPSDNSQAGFSRRHDVDRNGLIDQHDVELITPRWGVGSAQTAPANAPLMQLVTPATVALSETLIVALKLDAVAQLGGFEARLVYSPTLVEIQRVELGPLLGSSGRTAAILGPRINQKAGTVAFGGYTTGSAAGANRSDVVARVIFRVLKEGVATFDLQAPLAASRTGAPRLVRDQDAVVQIRSGQVQQRLFLPIIQKSTP